MRLVDTHCHLHLYEPEPQVADTTTVHVMTVDPEEYDAAREGFAGRENIRIALGLFPQPIAEQEARLDAFLERLPDTRLVGEIGLDYVTESEDERARQRRLLDRILAACDARHLLSLHSRRAAADTVDRLRGFPGTAILHWFSGRVSVIESADPALYWSVNTAMARRRSRARELVRAMPRDRVLTETDGPYIRVGDRPADPSDLPRVIEFLARVWDCEPEAAADQVMDNYRAAWSGPA